MKRYMWDVDWWRANVFKLLLELKETVFYFLFNIFRKLLLGADQLRVCRMSCLLHNATASTLESLLELVNATVRHRQLFVLIDLLGGLGCDTVNGRPCWVHLLSHARRCTCLVPSLWVVVGAAHVLAFITIIINRVRLCCTTCLLLDLRSLRLYLHLHHLKRSFLKVFCEWRYFDSSRFGPWAQTFIEGLNLAMAQRHDVWPISWQKSCLGELTTGLVL